MCAAPPIASELSAGTQVTLLVFPQVFGFVDLLDLGSNQHNLRTKVLPIGGSIRQLREFAREMSELSPHLVWISPHAPEVVASWKIPLLLWAIRTLYWPKAALAGASSEPLSRLFNIRVPIDRSLPYALREWTAYSTLLGGAGDELRMPKVPFKESIRHSRLLPSLYDIIIHPGAGTGNRKWPLQRYVQLMKHIPRHHRVAVTGVADDVTALRAVLPADRDLHFLTGSLEGAICAMSRARVALTMDSGSMFFAQALGLPAVSLFGPSDPANVIPAHWRITPVYDQKWSCQPCRRPECRQRSVYCMESLDAKLVADELLVLLAEASSGSHPGT